MSVLIKVIILDDLSTGRLENIRLLIEPSCHSEPFLPRHCEPRFIGTKQSSYLNKPNKLNKLGVLTNLTPDSRLLTNFN